MKRKILFNALGIVLSVAMLTSVCFALFTATSTIADNTLVNGSVSFSVRDPETDNYPLAFGNDPAKGTTVLREDNYKSQEELMANNELNLACGDTVKRVIEIKNTGTLDQYFRFYLKNVSLVSSAGETQANNLLNKWYKIKITGSNTHGGIKKPFRDNVSFGSLTGAKKAVAGFLHADDGKDYWRTIGTRAKYTIEITLDRNAPDTLQNSVLNFDIVMDAVQAANNFDKNQIPHHNYGGNNINIAKEYQDQISW